MNTDIEDYIGDKNKYRLKRYNYIDYSKFDLDLCKIIIINLLIWIDQNSNLLFVEHTKQLNKMFENKLNKEIRYSKTKELKKSVLLNIFNNLTSKKDFDTNLWKYFDILKILLRKKANRNSSGVTIVTMITAPFPDGQTFSCKHNCYYCPNEPAHENNNWQAQPRSYLYNEPAVLRANQHKFSSMRQMLNRLDTYFNNGLVIDKLEIIIEGGTYTEYPIPYLERYNRDIFYIANIYFDLRRNYPNYDTFDEEGLDLEILKKIRPPSTIGEEMKINKTATVHIIGICIETRPDAIDNDWLWRFRLWGITRIQLGVQHVNNTILKKINRGHSIEQVEYIMQKLKDNCYKIDIHIMPDLPGSSPEIDKEMFDYIYSTLFPDQMKVYPCEVVPWTVIEKWYKQGKYIPYYQKNPNDLFDVVEYSMAKCPNYIRLPRVQRDIPSTYIQCGSTQANLREIIDRHLDSQGIVSQDIRSREIGRHPKYYLLSAKYNIYPSNANQGKDYFIAYESYDLRALFGFIRLRTVDKENLTIFNVLKGRGLVRELHVYGDTQEVGILSTRSCQHTGIGKKLLKLAEKKSMEEGLYGIAVISGEGVKEYYEKNGYREVDTFMIKDFWFWNVWFCQLIKLILNLYHNYIKNNIFMTYYL